MVAVALHAHRILDQVGQRENATVVTLHHRGRQKARCDLNRVMRGIFTTYKQEIFRT